MQDDTKDNLLEFFAASIPGTERALCEELRELGFRSVRLNRGGVPFRGSWMDGRRACLQSRIAQRIQVLMGRFPAPSEDALYQGIGALDWSPYISPAQTLAVTTVCRASAITHSGFAALKVKDAIVDQVRAASGDRPSVDKDDADVRIFVHLANDRAAVYLDLSGEPLHRRGYRRDTGEAPLRETLAAAMLRISGWDRSSPLLDPMCGSGTIAIEAALWAKNAAPGINRGRFGFERWNNFTEEDADDLKALCSDLRRDASGPGARITACDIDAEVLEKARMNARAAGVRPSFKERSVFDLQTGEPGLIVTNPPYGLRLDKSPDFCRQFAAVVSRLHGWRVCILAGTPEYALAISSKPKFKVHIPSGGLDCEYLVYDVK